METTALVQCAVCATKGNDVVPFETEDDLRCHIAMEHVFWIPFECVICPRTLLPTEAVLKQHYDQIHPLKIPKAIYTYEEEKKVEVKRILALSRTNSKVKAVDKEFCIEIANNLRVLTEGAIDEDKMLSTTMTEEMMRSPTDIPSVTSATEMPTLTAEESNVIEPKQKQLPQFDNIDEEKQQPTNSQNDKIHHKDPTPVCRICSQKMSDDSLEARKQHIWHRHMPRAPVRCLLCTWSSYSDAHLKQHQQAHIRAAHPEAADVPLGQSFKDCRQKLAAVLRRKLEWAFGQTKLPQPAREEAKKKCYLCDSRLWKSNRLTHIWQHHMPMKRYACNVCEYRTSYASLMCAHAKELHGPGNQCCWTDNMKKLGEDYRNVFDSAFGGRYTTVTDKAPFKKNSDKKSRVPIKVEPTAEVAESVYVGRNIAVCDLCHHGVKNINDRGRHIWDHHVSQKRYQCRLCEYRVSKSTCMRKHVVRKHKGVKNICWSDISPQLLNEYTDLFERAFGKLFRKRRTKATARPLKGVFFGDKKKNKQRKIKLEVVHDKSDKTSEETYPANRTQESSMVQCNTCHQEISTGSKCEHIWQMHVTIKRYTCTLCDFTISQRKIAKRHVKEIHHHDDGECYVIDRQTHLAEEYSHAYQMAFDSSYRPIAHLPAVSRETTRASKQKALCNICDKVVANKWEHIWLRHTSSNRFACVLCEHTSALLKNFNKHATKHHNLADAKGFVTDRRTILADEFTELFQAAFKSNKLPKK